MAGRSMRGAARLRGRRTGTKQVQPCTPSGSFPLQSSLFLFVCCAAVVHFRVWSFLGMDSPVPQTQCTATLQPLTSCAPPPPPPLPRCAFLCCETVRCQCTGSASSQHQRQTEFSVGQEDSMYEEGPSPERVHLVPVSPPRHCLHVRSHAYSPSQQASVLGDTFSPLQSSDGRKPAIQATHASPMSVPPSPARC